MKVRLMIVAILTIVMLSANQSVQAAAYFNTEIYAKGNLFLTAGNSWDNPIISKLDVWGCPGSEIGLTMGPRIGPALIGVGASAGQINETEQLTYANVDLTFNAPIGAWNWSSYNLYQKGLHNGSDFSTSRNWITRDGYSWGVIGHNTKAGSNSWKLHWGLFYDLGQLNIAKSNKLCAAINVLNTSQAWVAWVISF